MRILAFDHFFWQDLDELSLIAEPEHEVIRISYQRWHQVARKFFPTSAFDGISNAYQADMSECWKKYEAWVRKETAWIMSAYRPNLFVTPSDVFFYLRPFITAFKEFGLNTFVMQKETTISPLVMDMHSVEIGRYVPFMSDFMTVCSERHKEFWLRAGVRSDLVAVTGQPRFDIYASASGHLSSDARQPKKILYLSYDDTAYLPSDLGAEFEGSWKAQRHETEKVLEKISSTHEVTVKKHPQQSVGDNSLGPRVINADRFADTRQLIIAADVVVGFQTTALYEAAAAGKPVIYAAWGEVFEQNRESLIRFDASKDLLTHAESPNQLMTLLSKPLSDLKKANEAGLSLVSEELGPIDGHATERTWDLMQSFFSDISAPRIKGIEKLRAVKQVFFVFFYFALLVASKVFMPARTEGIRRHLKNSIQVLCELKRLMTNSRKVVYD